MKPSLALALTTASWICGAVTIEGSFVTSGFASNSDWLSHETSRSLVQTRKRACSRQAMVMNMRSDEDGDEWQEQESGDDSPGYAKESWNPTLRKAMGSLAAVGALETAFLTAKKWIAPGDSLPFCGAVNEGIGSCSSVLDGPYATLSINGIDVPLSGFGFMAYSLMVVLCLGPLIDSKPSTFSAVESDDDASDVINRVLIVCLATAMATFSSFLLSLLFGVLHESCPYCVVSAGLSLILGTLSWTAGVLPPPSAARLAVPLGASSFLATTATSIALFFSTTSSNQGLIPSPLLASTRPDQLEQMAPPPITTGSSVRAKALAANLESLNSRMFGAYWCNHCYDQKQALGKEAMARIPYIECSREGINSQTDLCKERNVPGYPTWEIAGKLYPGEQDIEELEEIVKDATR